MVWLVVFPLRDVLICGRQTFVVVQVDIRLIASPATVTYDTVSSATYTACCCYTAVAFFLLLAGDLFQTRLWNN